jgi:hypothetical protein
MPSVLKRTFEQRRSWSLGPRLLLPYFLALLVVAASALATNDRDTRANGGQLRIDAEAVGPYRVYVFTDPTPLRVGSVDISVIVEDAATFETRFDVTVDVSAESLEYDVPPVGARASPAQADDPTTYQATVFDLPRVGAWRFVLTVTGSSGEVGRLTFEASASAERDFGQWPLILSIVGLPVIIGVAWYVFGNRRGPRDEGTDDAIGFEERDL